MANEAKKPEDMAALFDRLARKLIRVPKAEVERREAKRKKRGK